MSKYLLANTTMENPCILDVIQCTWYISSLIQKQLNYKQLCLAFMLVSGIFCSVRFSKFGPGRNGGFLTGWADQRSAFCNPLLGPFNKIRLLMNAHVSQNKSNRLEIVIHNTE